MDEQNLLLKLISAFSFITLEKLTYSHFNLGDIKMNYLQKNLKS